MRCQVILHKCKEIASCQLALNSLHRRFSSFSSSWILEHKPPSSSRKSCCVHSHCRRFSSKSTTSIQQDVFLPGNVFQSPLSNIDIPNIPFHELMFKKFEDFLDEPATSEFLINKGYTFRDVKTNAIKVASALTRLGYKKGDIILLFSSNNIDYTILMLAASCIGVVVTSANPTFTAEELTRQINHSKAIAVVTSPALAETTKAALKREELLKAPKGLFAFGEADGFMPFQKLLDDDGLALPDVPINPKEDLLVLPYSSGTTGLPKGVMLTHHNILSNVMQTCNSLPMNVGENGICLLPLYHIYGMVVIQFGALYSGGHLHYLPKYEPESFLKCLQDRKVNIAHLVPPLVLFLAKHPDVSNYDLSNLRRIMCAAAPLGNELTLEIVNRFAPNLAVNQGYGLTETGPVVNLEIGKNPGSVGNLVCNTLGKVVDLTTGEPLGPNEEGEVCVKGPQVMKGYFNNQAATDEMVTADGWLHTGDIGYYDENAVIFISDRLKELIKYKGSQVAPAELEALLLGHKDVLDVAVVGVPDEAAGELPCAFVVKKPNTDVSEQDIIKYVEERVSHVKRLRGGVQFVDNIPRNPSGKILRRTIKQEYLSK